MLSAPPKAENRPFSLSSYENLLFTLNAILDLMFELDAEGRHWNFRALGSEYFLSPPEQLLDYIVSGVMRVEAALAVMNVLNDTKGHDAVDLMLQQIAQRMCFST